jgi:D-glycero-D-manno-heptose 1,7-bisphosphate phosphatase
VTGDAPRPAVFLDRDGVLNLLVERGGVLVSPSVAADFRICEGAPEAVAALRRAGLPVFVVTNQPDLARGGLDWRQHELMLDALRSAVAVDEVGVCPHDDADRCACRKPAPGLLQDLARRHGIDLSRSVVVGDGWKDVEAGRRAGCRTILLRRPYNEAASADVVVGTLADAVARILEPGSRISS